MSSRTNPLSSSFTNSKAAQPLQNTPSSANCSSLSSSDLDDVDVYETDGYYSRCWDGWRKMVEAWKTTMVKMRLALSFSTISSLVGVLCGFCESLMGY